MKQTRSALTMLLNAYRSIFAHSYLKGLAAGVIATSVLAAGAASAEDLSESLVPSAQEVTEANATVATTAEDNISASGYAYSLTVGSNYGLTISSGEVEVVTGPNSINGTLSIASGASLTLVQGNSLTTAQEEEIWSQTGTFGLAAYAQSLGSGTVNITTNGSLTLDAGIYDLSDLTVNNSGSLVVAYSARVLLDSVSELAAMGSVDIKDSPSNDENEGTVIITADTSRISNDLFGENKVHSSNDGGIVEVKNLIVTDSTLSTYGVTLQSNGDTYLTVDEDNVFTIEGASDASGSLATSEMGLNLGDVRLIDEDGNTVSDGTIVIANGGELWFADWMNPDESHYIYADIEVSGGYLGFDEGTWTGQDVTITNGGRMELSYYEPGGTTILNNVTMSSGRINIEDGTTLKVNTLKTTSGSIRVDGTLSVEGDGNAEKVDLVLSGSFLTLSSTGTLNLNDGADTVGLALSTDDNGTFSTDQDYVKIPSQGGTIEVDVSSLAEELTYAQANSLFAALVTDGSTGLAKIDGATVDLGAEYDEVLGGFVVSASDVANITFYTDSTLNAIVTGVSGAITGGWQAVVLAQNETSASVSEDGTLIIAGATASGNLVQAYDGSVAGLTLGSGANANLTGTGSIGTISGDEGALTVTSGAQVSVEADGNGSAISVDSLTVSNAAVSAAGSVTANEMSLAIGSNLSATEVKTASLVMENSELTAENLTLSEGEGSEGSYISDGSTVVVTGTATVEHDLTVAGGSAVTASVLELGEDVTLQVSEESSVAGSATLEAGYLSLSGGTLILGTVLN